MEFYEEKIALEQLSALLDLELKHISIATFDYHQTSVFPVNVFVLVARDDGSGDSTLDIPSMTQRYPLLAGHAYFVPCELEARFDITPSISILSIHFNLAFYHGLDVFSAANHCETRHDPDLVARLFALVNDGTDDFKTICALKMELMRFCLSCWPERLGQLALAARKHEPILRYIHEHGTAELTVRDLAALAGVRQEVFSRRFSRDIGRSPQQIIHSDLLKKIAARLLLPRTSVKQVADDLKFSSEFYMSRFFKRHASISPSEYQRRFRK